MNRNIARSALKAQIGLLIAVLLFSATAFLKNTQPASGAPFSGFWPVLSLFTFSCAVIYYLLWHSVDRVEDCGSYFVVRRHRTTQTIKLEEIAWVGFKLQKPPLVTFNLLQPSQFGSEISFIPAADFWRILIDQKCLLADDINRRIAAAKSA